MPFIGNTPDVNFTSFAKQTITGNGGTSYTLSHAVANENEVEIFVNNVRQEGGSGKAYTVSGTALTMTGNVANTDSFYVIFLGKALQTTVPPDGSVSTAKIASSAVDLTSKVTGVLPVANGGTGATSYVETNSVIETFYYHSGDIAESNNAILDATWTRDTSNGTANKNGGMSASSGIWTFPSTGIWQVTLLLYYYVSAAHVAKGITLRHTPDNGSNHNDVFSMYNNVYTSNGHSSIAMPWTFNITDTSNQKISYKIAGTNITVGGGSSAGGTRLNFIKLCPSV